MGNREKPRRTTNSEPGAERPARGRGAGAARQRQPTRDEESFSEDRLQDPTIEIGGDVKEKVGFEGQKKARRPNGCPLR